MRARKHIIWNEVPNRQILRQLADTIATDLRLARKSKIQPVEQKAPLNAPGDFVYGSGQREEDEVAHPKVRDQLKRLLKATQLQQEHDQAECEEDG